MKNTKAAEMLKGRTTTQLINDFILAGEQLVATEDTDKFVNLSTVRGWIMDELEERNPEALNEWLEAYRDDKELLKYFKVA